MHPRVPPTLSEPNNRSGGGIRVAPKGDVAQNAWGTVKRLWQYLKQYRIRIIITLCAVIVTTVSTVLGSYLLKPITNDLAGGSIEILYFYLPVMLGIYLVGSFVSWIQVVVMTKISQDTVFRIREDAFKKLQTLSLNFFDSKSHGDIMSRITNDVDNINNMLSNAGVQLLSGTITSLGTLILMVFISPLLALVTFLVVPLMFFAIGMITKYTRKQFMLQQKSLGDLNSIIEETMTGQKVVSIFAHEKEQIEGFSKASSELKQSGLRAQIFSGMIMPVMNIMNNLGYTLVAVTGAVMIINNMVDIGGVAVFLTFSRQFARPVAEIANQFNLIQSAVAGAERIFEILDETPKVIDAFGANALDSVEGKVVFEDVSFSYDKRETVLKNIGLEAKPGQVIALVGPTGSGKTTVVNLLTRFYDVDSGRILIDGKDIGGVTQESLRKLLGIVLQDTRLFSESVADNIRYGKLDATDEEIKKAVVLSNADLFIRHLPNKYDTVLTEDGGDLSQGQRQLIAIARAMLKDPAILILDEATSSIDTLTEKHIQDAMLKLMEGRTSFVIAHRLSTIVNADLILVINAGEIIERGTHQELIEAEGFYAKLYNSQFAGLEKNTNSIRPLK